MKSDNFIASAETTINAPVEKVWNALINPEMIKKYMFGTIVVSDWKEGSRVTWSGEWEGKYYVDKGEILKIKPYQQLQYTHFSPLAGIEDKPENYPIVTINLEKNEKQTTISLSQNNNATREAKEHSEKNWKMMLESLKKILEENT